MKDVEHVDGKTLGIDPTIHKYWNDIDGCLCKGPLYWSARDLDKNARQ